MISLTGNSKAFINLLTFLMSFHLQSLSFNVLIYIILFGILE